MSDLQIALLLIGVFIVAAVLIFNWNQERRFKKQAAAALQPTTRDALLERSAAPRPNTERIDPALHEPVLRSDGAKNYSSPPVGHTRISAPVSPPLASNATAGTVAPIVIPSTDKPAKQVMPVPPAPYDELIEYRVCLEGEGILAAVFAEDINRTRGFGKPTRWLGFPVDGNAWEEVQPWRDAFYRAVQVTLQLADRNGAVQEDELMSLCGLLQATAQSHGLHIICDDAAEALHRAQSVDHFCVDVDVLIGLNVVAHGEGVMKLSKVLKEIESTGMVLGVDGAYRLLDSRGESLYSLCNHDAEPFSSTALQQDTEAVTLQFDVPRVPDGLKVFDGMVSFGRKLANEVGGLLVDDNMRPLTEGGIDKIRQQLAAIYQRMEARGVLSGSRRALRLFS